MAIRTVGASSRLRLQFIEGLDDEGKETLSSRSYSNVKPEAEDEAVYNVAIEISGLQEKPVKAVLRTDEKEITQE
ncbi:MAG: DUF1659 domain-containing protein [Clostridiaceae bacterium]|nr:DUF1659 domain-containing protein [Clostridiaceae bacterium]